MTVKLRKVPEPDSLAAPIRVIDLFAGAGGFTAGFKKASPRFVTVRAVEWDVAAAASYEATFGEDLVYAGSIQDWLANETVPEADLIVGGPPCQGFSTLGKQAAEDERNTLWRQYVQTIIRAKPKYFVVENVAAFAESPQYALFKAETELGGSLEEYDFQFKVLNAADYGAPQARKRTVIIGHLKSLAFPGFPEPTHVGKHVSVRTAFASIPARVTRTTPVSTDTITFGIKTLAGPFTAEELHIGRSYTQISLDRFAEIPEGGNRFDLAKRRPDLLPPCWVKHTTGSADVMGRLHWTKPSVTIRTEFFKPEKGRYLHPTEHRAITHYEAAILQGFPPEHKFVGSKTAIAKQIGNAVPIPLGEAIARMLLRTMS
ncbi:DNA cytosine methyltransferase [Agromyces laixinhei]|uniref:DNA cytosine methyltransferase n=1 Tax=Agromyces laixinhei TaxID=2585717 RepID=UPI0012EDCB44|nr:DNA cytosine methyltransferase [Agromyces laixinhei]